VLTRRVIPCLDCRDGRVVKGVKFQHLRDAGDPVALSVEYMRQGADELVLLDVSATPSGRGHQLEVVRAIRRELSIALTCGGGVRSEEDASRLLDAGADKVGVNTAAVRDPGVLERLAGRFGSQCVVLALDAASTREGGWEVVVTSGTERPGLDAAAWASRAQDLGAGELLLTSWDRDGTRQGYDLALLRAMAAAVTIPIIASGGADSARHMAEALAAGAHAVLAASIFHDGDTTVQQIKAELAALGIAVRTSEAAR
jgi:imidazoleglycerol phosphate synthase cyclase subunit